MGYRVYDYPAHLARYSSVNNKLWTWSLVVNVAQLVLNIIITAALALVLSENCRYSTGIACQWTRKPVEKSTA